MLTINNIFTNYTNGIISSINFNHFNNKKILLTGSSGLLGVHIVECLKTLKKKYNIEVYLWMKSEISPYHKEIFDFENFVIQEEITDSKSFESLPNFDYILHCAGYGQPSKFLEEKIKTIKINTNATINLLEKLNKDGTFLFLSSSEVYNGLNKFSITEKEIGTSNTNDSRSCYIESKRCGESICYSYAEKGYDVKIVRLSLAYGPGTKSGDKRVLNSIIERGLHNGNIELLDSGQAIRTYCYVSDVVEMMFNILLHSKEIVYNVGGFTQISILELAEKVGCKLNKNVKLPETSKKIKGSPDIVNISVEKYLNEFNKKTFIDIEEGIENTIIWQKYIYNL